jgi:hypothetical protein
MKQRQKRYELMVRRDMFVDDFFISLSLSLFSRLGIVMVGFIVEM